MGWKQKTSWNLGSLCEKTWKNHIKGQESVSSLQRPLGISDSRTPIFIVMMCQNPSTGYHQNSWYMNVYIPKIWSDMIGFDSSPYLHGNSRCSRCNLITGRACHVRSASCQWRLPGRSVDPSDLLLSATPISGGEVLLIPGTTLIMIVVKYFISGVPKMCIYIYTHYLEHNLSNLLIT